MGSVWSVGRTTSSKEEKEMALSKVKQTISSNPAVVFSKTWCGYCKRVKQLFSELNVSFKLYELDEETVMEQHRAGKLVPMLTEAGAIGNTYAQQLQDHMTLPLSIFSILLIILFLAALYDQKV